MYAAMIAGSIAAIVDALVSLPLRSPDDALFNSATVVVGALISGAGWPTAKTNEPASQQFGRSVSFWSLR